MAAEWDKGSLNPSDDDFDPELFLNEELFDAMGDLCKPYMYFGARPGDGADFGFWLSESLESDFDGLKGGGEKAMNQVQSTERKAAWPSN